MLSHSGLRPVGLVVAVLTILMLTMTAAAAPVALAAGSTIRVTTTRDEQMSNTKCSLREAVLSANADQAVGGCPRGAGADTIVVPPGRFVLDWWSGGPNEDAAQSGDLDIWTTLTVRGSSGAATIIDGNSTDRIFQVLAGGRVTLDRLTVMNGYVAPASGRPAANRGGAISNFGNLTVTNSLITHNRTADGGLGGGMFSSGMVTIRDSWITDNTAEGGGGLYSAGSAYVIRTHVESNYAIGMDSHPPTLPGPNNSVVSPSAGEAGGITAEGYLSVSRSVIAGNSGGNEWGHGGIAMQKGVISESTIADNSTDVCGTGGIAMVSSQLIASTVTGNSNGNCGPSAGGVYAVNSEIINTTISGNRAFMAVAGIRSEGSRIINSTITRNSTEVLWMDPVRSVGTGGLEAAAGQTLVRNTIIAGNTGGTGHPDYLPVPDCSGIVTSGGHNLIGDPTRCDFRRTPTDLVGVDPKIGPLANNGGPTLTHTLRPGSPAIDAWYDGSVGAGASCPKFDQRGVHRPQDGNRDGVAKCDIGALERM